MDVHDTATAGVSMLAGAANTFVNHAGACQKILYAGATKDPAARIPVRHCASSILRVAANYNSCVVY